MFPIQSPDGNFVRLTPARDEGMMRVSIRKSILPLMNYRILAFFGLGCLLFPATEPQRGLQAQSAVELAGASRPRPQMQLTNRDRQYKRIHQFALRLILLFRYSEAKTFLEEHLQDHPEDPESHFLMGVWHARQGQWNPAVKWMSEAIEKGLPPGRIAAGQETLLRGARDGHPWFDELFEKLRTESVHGPMLGHLTHNAASFWVRTAEPAEFTITSSQTADFSARTVSAKGMTRQENDGTGIVRLTGLSPDTRYSYRVTLAGQDSASYQFRTLVPPGTSVRYRLVFGGGAGYVPPNERVWTTIKSLRPDALLLLGDNVYIDDPESPVMQRYTYHRRQSRPEWRDLTAATAVYSIWDDHDFSTNDSWGGPEIMAPFWKPFHVYPIFRDNWVNPGYGGNEAQPGCWYTFRVGDIDFVMLDCRYYRTDPKNDHPSMLGPAQLAWLKTTLRELTGTFKVICSSVPWDYRTKGDSLDTWNGFKEEREAIFSFIEQEKIEGILLISADRHRSDAWKIERPDYYDFYEFNSSRLTNQHVHQEMNHRGAIFSYNKKQSFGLVEFDTVEEDPSVTYSVVTIDGETVHQLTVRCHQLRW